MLHPVLHVVTTILNYFSPLFSVVGLEYMGKNHQGGKLQVWFYDEKTWKL
jgi:hypothetical protein